MLHQPDNHLMRFAVVASAALVAATPASCGHLIDLLPTREATSSKAQPLASRAPTPIFASWRYMSYGEFSDVADPRFGDECRDFPDFVYTTPYTYVPVNHTLGQHGGPGYADGTYAFRFGRCNARGVAEVGAPVAIMIRNRNCPFPFATGGGHADPQALQQALDNIPRLDYLLMDLEPIDYDKGDEVEDNLREIVSIVRSHPNPSVSNAHIGNYQFWPGPRDEAMPFPNNWRDRNDFRAGTDNPADALRYDDLYRELGLNVAMPVAYPYEYYVAHADPVAQKGNATPNVRAALFWAPLERVSEALRYEMDGHVTIPWVSQFVEWNNYEADPPETADLRALIQHLRLRGCHSFYTFASDDHPEVGVEAYRTLTMRAWADLDGDFSNPDGFAPSVMNLDLDKKSGLMWSGVRVGGSVTVLVSNLSGDGTKTVPLPDWPGLPDATPAVPEGTHRIFRWKLIP